jgi:hypothetical protein
MLPIEQVRAEQDDEESSDQKGGQQENKEILMDEWFFPSENGFRHENWRSSSGKDHKKEHDVNFLIATRPDYVSLETD